LLFTKKITLILWSTFLGSALFAQTVVTGLDAVTGQRIVATVSLEDGTVLGTDSVVYIQKEDVKKVKLYAVGYEEKWINVIPNKNHFVPLLPKDFQLEDAVVTSVFQNRTEVNTVMRVQKVKEEEIERMGAADLRDALAFQSNIQIRRDNAIGSSGLSIMGMSGTNVKILQDGVPVVGRFFGQLDLEQFNLENAQQIEVIQGPMSVIYGSDALAGTVNIISRKPDKSRFSFLGNYETDGQYNLSGSATKALKNGALSFNAGRMFFDGWSENKTDRSYDWMPKEQYTFGLTYVLERGNNQITFRTSAFQARLLDKGSPSSPYFETAIDQKYQNRRLDNSITWNRQLENGRLQLIAANNHFGRLKNRYSKDLVTLTETLVPVAAEQDTQQFNASVLRAVWNNNLKHGVQMVLGFDGNHEMGEGARINGISRSQTDLAGFVSLDKTFFHRLTVRGGLRYAYNSAYQAPLIYSLQSQYRLSNSRVFKFAYGKGFRAPSLKELYLNFVDSNHEVVGNEDLKAEHSHSFTGSYTKYYIWENWRVTGQVEAFYNVINNKIELFQFGSNAAAATYGNISNFKTGGGLISMQVAHEDFALRTSFNYTGVSNGLGESDDYIFTPQLVFQPQYQLRELGTSFQLFYNWFGRIANVTQDDEGNVFLLEQDAYSMMDITVHQPFLNNSLRITCGIRNVFNVVNLNSTLVQGGAHGGGGNSLAISPGRTYFISLRYVLEK
jgi:outer membrane receptor for ferrienterochelin and colicins